MKRTVVLFANILALLAASPAWASIADRVLGIDVGVNLPLQNFANATGTQFGALIRYEHKLQPKMALTLRGGWLRGSEREITVGATKFSVGIDSTTVLAGLVYRESGTPEGLFATGELGVNWPSSHSAAAVASTTATASAASPTQYCGSIGVGYRTGPLSFRGAGLVQDLSHSSDSMGALFTVGWDFKTL